MTNRFIRTLLKLFLLGFVVSAWASDNCGLAAPPRAAGVNGPMHGTYFIFIFPRQIDAKYTGCQTMWDESGQRIMVFRFEQGALASFEQFVPMSAKPVLTREGRYTFVPGTQSKAVLTCRYRPKSSIALDKDCPPLEDGDAGTGGLMTVSPPYEPTVPRERDPRKD